MESKRLQSMNLAELGMVYAVDWNALPEETAEKLISEGYDEPDEGTAYISACDIEYFDVPYDAVDTDFVWEDDDEALYVWNELINEAGYYLVCLKHCTWDKRNAAFITDDVFKTVSRDYDVIIRPYMQSPDRKVLVCTESSHDVPMGHLTYIVALTDEEYEMLKEGDLNAVEFTEDLVKKAFPDSAAC